MRLLVIALSLVVSACAGHQLVGQVSTLPSKGYLVQRVNVFDGEKAIGARDVRIADGKIAEVAEAGSLKLQEGEGRIDGTGRTLLPGLVDVHAHLESHGEPMWAVGFPNLDDIAQAYLYSGVTSALVMQGAEDQFALAKRIRKGELIGPRLWMAGPRLTAPDGFPINLYRALLGPFAFAATGAMHTAATVDEANADVEATAAKFAPEFYKITCDAFPPGAPKLAADVMTAAIRHSKELKMRPTAHIGAPEDIMIAAEAGLELFAHPPNGAVLSREQVTRLAELKIPFVSTQRFLTASDELGKDGGNRLERALLRPKLLQKFAEKPADFRYPGVPPEMDVPKALAQYRENLRENLRLLHAAGIPIFIGTDAGSPGVIPGAALHRELKAVLEAGLTPEEALRAATSAPADFLDPQHGFGRIAAGQRADLLLVVGDPTVDIAATEAISDIFLAGTRIARTRRE